MEIILHNVKTDKENANVFTATVKVNGVKTWAINRAAGEYWPMITYTDHRKSVELGPKAIEEVTKAGWAHIQAYINHLYEQHQEQRKIEFFTENIEKLCQKKLVYRTSKHQKEHEFDTSDLRDTPAHRDYLRRTFDESHADLGISLTEFINDRFKKPVILTEGLFTQAV